MRTRCGKADFCKAYPDRLFGAAMLPMISVDKSIEEMRFAAKELQMRSGFIRPNPYGTLSDVQTGQLNGFQVPHAGALHAQTTLAQIPRPVRGSGLLVTEPRGSCVRLRRAAPGPASLRWGSGERRAPDR